MRLRGRTVVLGRAERLVALLAASSLGACAGKGSGACATKVTPEVCETPANLRGVEPVQETRVVAPAPQLVPEPLIDGRYVQTARTRYCEQDYQPLLEQGGNVQAVTEISGCVLRSTIVAAGEQPLVFVLTFRYAADGTLDVTPACSGDKTPVLGRQYGFDGTTLQFPSSSDESDSDGLIHTCERIDSFELR